MSFEIRSFNESVGGEGPESGVYTAAITKVDDPEFWAFPEAGLSPEELEAKRKWVTRFTFVIENDEEWSGAELKTKRIDFTIMSERSNNYKLWKALTGDDFDPNRKYRPSEAVGHRCQIVVTKKDNGYSDITGFMPVKKARQGGTRTVNQAMGQAPTDVDDIPF